MAAEIKTCEDVVGIYGFIASLEKSESGQSGCAFSHGNNQLELSSFQAFWEDILYPFPFAPLIPSCLPNTEAVLLVICYCACYSLPTKGENKVTACLMKHIPMCLIFKVCLCPENNVKILFWSNSSRLHLLILSSDLWSHFSFKSWPRSLDSTVKMEWIYFLCQLHEILLLFYIWYLRLSRNVANIYLFRVCFC